MTTLTSTGAVNLTSSTNWSPAQTPVAGDDLVIGAHTLTLDADMTLNTITINHASCRFAISGTTRSVGATNGFIIAGGMTGGLISTTLTTGMSVTLTGKWIWNSNLALAPLVASTGGNLTLQTVGASPSAILFDYVALSVAQQTIICSSWTGGTLTTIGRFNAGTYTGSATLITMSGGTWLHQSTGTNSFGAGAGRLCALSGTATINWTGSLTTAQNITTNGIFTLSSSSTSHTIGEAGNTFDLTNVNSSTNTYLIGLSAGTLEIFGEWYHVDGALLVYQGPNGTLRYRNQSLSVPSNRCTVSMVYGGTMDVSGLVVTVAGKFAAIAIYQAAVFTTSSGTSVTCTSTSAFAIALGTTSFNGKIITLESDPPTLPAVADVTAGEVYGYSGIELTGTGLVMDPATLATAMLTSFGSLPEVLTKTTIATLASQTEFTLTAGSADNDVYNGLTAVITDQGTSIQKAVVTVSGYVGSTKSVTLSAAPGFTIATGDMITVIAGGSSGGGGSFPSVAPADWLGASGIAANALNGKGDWATAGAQMDLINSPNATARQAFATTIEAAILNEADATALLAAISNKVEEFLINDGDAVATLTAIATAVNAAVVAGQIGTDAAAAKAAAESVDGKLTAPRLAKIDGAAQTGADGDTLETLSDQIDGVSGGGGGTDWTADERTAIRAALGIPTSGTTLLDPSTGILDTIRDQVVANGAALAGAPVQPTGRIASGGAIVAYIGDDFRVRSGTQLEIPVSDPSGGLYTKLNAIGAENLAFGASRPEKAAGSISGTVASLATSGSGASQLLLITVEITNCGSGLKPGDDYTYQIEQRQTQGTEVDSFVEIEGSLELRKKTV